MDENTQLLTPKEAAKKLHTTAGTLAVWRCRRRQPLAFVRVGRRVFYRVQDVESYITKNLDPGNGPVPVKAA